MRDRPISRHSRIVGGAAASPGADDPRPESRALRFSAEVSLTGAQRIISAGLFFRRLLRFLARTDARRRACHNPAEKRRFLAAKLRNFHRFSGTKPAIGRLRRRSFAAR